MHKSKGVPGGWQAASFTRHEAQANNQTCPKIDYEKAYDKDNLDFRGFGSKWINWIDMIAQNGTIGGKINGESVLYY